MKKPNEEEKAEFPKKLRKTVKREKDGNRGLLICEKCREKIHRDENGAINIGNILIQRLRDGTRPDYLQRPSSSSSSPPQKVIVYFC